MKLATFQTGSTSHTGAVVEDGVVDLTAAGLPARMIDLIAGWDRHEAKAREIVNSTKPQLRLSQLHLQAPVPDPQKILAIGLNYADHIAESGQAKPEKQIWFSNCRTPSTDLSIRFRFPARRPRSITKPSSSS